MLHLATGQFLFFFFFFLHCLAFYLHFPPCSRGSRQGEGEISDTGETDIRPVTQPVKIQDLFVMFLFCCDGKHTTISWQPRSSAALDPLSNPTALVLGCSFIDGKTEAPETTTGKWPSWDCIRLCVVPKSGL